VPNILRADSALAGCRMPGSVRAGRGDRPGLRGSQPWSRSAPGDRILSFDAKPQINTRSRPHPTLPAAPGRPVRYEHEYKRKGSLALLADLDVHTGQVFASTPLTTGIKPFMNLVSQVMARPKYTNAPRVFVIVDNGSDHRGKASARRLARAHPNAIMIHTPLHASWLNQIVRYEVACDEWNSSKEGRLMSTA
jgi:hypothetical protein